MSRALAVMLVAVVVVLVGTGGCTALAGDATLVCAPGVDLDGLVNVIAGPKTSPLGFFGDTLDLDITRDLDVRALSFTNRFDVAGGTVHFVQLFDQAGTEPRNDAAIAEADLEVNVDDGANEVDVDTGLTCNAAPRTAHIHVSLPSLATSVR